MNVQAELTQLREAVRDLARAFELLQEAHAVQAAEIKALRLQLKTAEHGRTVLSYLERQ